MRVLKISDIRSCGGVGLVIAVTFSWSLLRGQERTADAFKTDASWCWLRDGSLCPPEVGNAWEAYKIRNLLAGLSAYEAYTVGKQRPESPEYYWDVPV
jgi:hypothetical protein